jgi:hypothetical protein
MFGYSQEGSLKEGGKNIYSDEIEAIKRKYGT